MASASPGTCQKCRLSDPTPDLLSQSLWGMAWLSVLSPVFQVIPTYTQAWEQPGLPFPEPGLTSSQAFSACCYLNHLSKFRSVLSLSGSSPRPLRTCECLFLEPTAPCWWNGFICASLYGTKFLLHFIVNSEHLWTVSPDWVHSSAHTNFTLKTPSGVKAMSYVTHSVNKQLPRASCMWQELWQKPRFPR